LETPLRLLLSLRESLCSCALETGVVWLFTFRILLFLRTIVHLCATDVLMKVFQCCVICFIKLTSNSLTAQEPLRVENSLLNEIHPSIRIRPGRWEIWTSRPISLILNHLQQLLYWAQSMQNNGLKREGCRQLWLWLFDSRILDYCVIY
jgi:hypothetical protein